MTTPRPPDLIVAAWLEEGPTDLPDLTRRAIAVGLRTTDQRRRGLVSRWTDPAVNSMVSRVGLGAIAVMVAIGGLSLFGNRAPGSPGGVGGQPSLPRPSPSSTPSSAPPDSAAVPAMTQTFVSPYSGYTVRYPIGWIVESGPNPWTDPSTNYADLDVISGPGGVLRSGSIMAPEDAPIDNWIDRFITTAMDNACNGWQVTLPVISIDGQAGRVRDTCPGEIEATVVVGRRVYLFTVFSGEPNLRYVFDAFAATIDLRPENATDASSPSAS